ncbi:MAG: hypothetical protein AAGA20_23165 [Planctomycetota bacterium]
MTQEPSVAGLERSVRISVLALSLSALSALAVIGGPDPPAPAAEHDTPEETPLLAGTREDLPTLGRYIFVRRGETTLDPALLFLHDLEGHHDLPSGLAVYADGSVVDWDREEDTWVLHGRIRGFDWIRFSWQVAILDGRFRIARSSPSKNAVAPLVLSTSFGRYFVFHFLWRDGDGLRCVAWPGEATPVIESEDDRRSMVRVIDWSLESIRRFARP